MTTTMRSSNWKIIIHRKETAPKQCQRLSSMNFRIIFALVLVNSPLTQAQFYGFSQVKNDQANSIAKESHIPAKTITLRAGQNVTLSCPGLTKDSLIRELVWTCRGCHSSSSHETKILEISTKDDDKRAKPHRPNVGNRVSLSKDLQHGLVLNPVMAKDSGEYSCLVNNRKTPNGVIRLSVRDVPDTPGRPLIMSFTSRSVNLSWTPPLNNHNSAITNYIIQIRVGEEGEWSGTTDIESLGSILTPSNATVYQVQDLQPFTTYSFRVTALNAMGRSKHSKESYYMLTLREVPSGRPTITEAGNTSSTSIQIAWRPPHPSTLHGEFLGYRIAYKPRNSENDSSEIREILIKDPSVEKFTIQRLSIFTQYLVSLQVYNPEGLGPSTTVVVMTDEGVPSRPDNVSFEEVTDFSVRIHWQKPRHPNGLIQGYRLYFMHRNFTDVRTVRDSGEDVDYQLDGLVPFTKYKLWLKAFTWKNEGAPSEPLEVMTDVYAPSAPIITNLSCVDESSIFMAWEKPAKVYKEIDFYFVYFRSEDKWQFQEIVLPRNGSRNADTEILLVNLTTNSMHELKVRAATKSLYNSTLIYRGNFSESHRILMQLNCDQVKASTIVRTADISGVEFSAGMIAGGACIAFAMILGILAFVLWRKYFNEAYYYLDESVGTSTPAPSIVPDWDIEAPTPLGSPSHDNGVMNVHTNLPNLMVGGTKRPKTAIPAHLFIGHVNSLHADDNALFMKEYEALQNMSTKDAFAANSSYMEDNKIKNRYHNVVAYDHSRVQLRALPGQKRGDYVNANYIDGFQKSRAYIATQGPLPSTFDSFWRMIWEQKVRVVVMITNLVERGRRKCDLYWPKEGCQVYGLIEVTLTNEDVQATHTIRTFKIRHTKIKSNRQKLSERYVLQYHYTNWPDHGVPENPLPVLSFVKKSSASNRDTDGPIVVHCSAGVGRTGAYILIDAMLKQMKAKGELNLVAYLKHIRTQRNFLVQTEEQYIFVHDALAEAVASGETNINRSYLSRYINSLQSSFTTDEKSIPWQMLDRQFKLATAYHPLEAQFTAALKICNQTKNQNFDYLPIESARVALIPSPGSEGSDYINASWLPGYNELREFIITQHPMQQTIPDFWQMLWEHNARTVVVLSALQQPEFGIFWPTHGKTIDLTSIKVKLVEETQSSGYQTKEFNIISLHDEYELSVKLIFCPSWPHHCSPLSTTMDLVRVVQATKFRRPSGPLVVVDRFGGTEAATFCALTTLLKQLDSELHIDVYQYAKVAHNRRPGIWKCQDDYLYLYRVMESVSCDRESSKKSSPKSHTGKVSTSPKRLMNGTVCSTNLVPLTNGLSNGKGSYASVRIPPDGMECASNEAGLKASF